MGRRVAFLRAVNVGSRRVSMDRARAVLEGLDLADVESYANTGNLLFTADGRAEALERRIRAALEDEFGMELTTFVRSAAQLRELVSARPFGTIAAGHTHFALLTHGRLTAADRRTVEAMSNATDEVVAAGRDVHWLIRTRSPETTLGPGKWQRALPGNVTTARNMTLLTRLVARL